MEFSMVSQLLRLLCKYQVMHLRAEVLRGLYSAWPSTLALWDLRETKATNSAGSYSPRETLPHPMCVIKAVAIYPCPWIWCSLVIKLGRDIKAPEILPSAFYDLSRYPPSHAAIGYNDPETSELHELSSDDLLNLLRGREHASRFLSTFIVNELEARPPSEWCIYRNEEDFSRQRACRVAFEAITFELLSDVGGVFCKRSSDPLYAIVDSELMQTRYDISGTGNKNGFKACEACRTEFAAMVDAAREELWGKLPLWFGIEVESWGWAIQYIACVYWIVETCRCSSFCIQAHKWTRAFIFHAHDRDTVFLNRWCRVGWLNCTPALVSPRQTFYSHTRSTLPTQLADFY